MKKLIGIGLFMFSYTILLAQSSQTLATNPDYNAPKTKGFQGGLMISPFVTWMQANVDNPSINNIHSPNAKLGFSYGLTGNFFFSNNYGLGVNILISGFDEQFDYYNDANKPYYIGRNLHLQYVDIPITLKMRTNEIGYMRYFAQFGFQPSVKLSAKADIDSAGIPGIQGLNVSSDVNLFMLYSVVGIGAEYDLGGNTNLVFGLTWHNGFTNIWNKANNVSSPDPNTNSNFNTPVENISLNVGILF